MKNNSSIRDKHTTRVDFAGVLDLDANEQARTPVGSIPPRDTLLISKKRKIMASQDYEATKRRDKENLLDNRGRPIQPGLRELQIVKAVKSGVSVLDEVPVMLESPWDHYHKRYELNVDGFASIVTDRSYPHDLFIVRCLKGPDTDQKIGIL